MKQMDTRWLIGVSFLGYGVSLMVGIGLPIPILDEETLFHAAIPDEEIYASVIDYSDAYPQRKPDIVGEVTYRELKSGKVTIQGKEVPCAPLSSYSRALEIAQILKGWIREGRFLLGEPVTTLPSADSGISFRPLKERPIQDQ
jgi:uncharacterized protein (DUF39 family)